MIPNARPCAGDGMLAVGADEKCGSCLVPQRHKMAGSVEKCDSDRDEREVDLSARERSDEDKRSNRVLHDETTYNGVA